MLVYKKKSNSVNIQEFILPINASYNSKNYVHITINIQSNTFLAKKLKSFTFNPEQWQETTEFTFPVNILSHFLKSSLD
jgi:hypothetical protein